MPLDNFGFEMSQWYLVTVNTSQLGPLAKGWKLRIESAPYLNGPSADFQDTIAIDDILFADCAENLLFCFGNFFDFNSLLTGLIGNPNDYLLPLRCSFENDFCGWSNSVAAKIPWQRSKGKTEGLMTGPSNDQ